MRPLFLAAARPMKVEWKISPYLGVFPRVFRALEPGEASGESPGRAAAPPPAPVLAHRQCPRGCLPAPSPPHR